MLLEVCDIYKSFGQNRVLQGISLSAKGGRAIGLLGRNGAGKTTAIRIIMDVFPPDGGNIMFDGRPLKQQSISIGYLPEEHGLYPKIEVIDQLIYLGKLRGMGAKDAKASVIKWMKRLEIEEYLKRRLETLSKGNQQKIQLVATLLNNPDIVILDEPFSGLDPVNAALLKDVVKEIINEGKIVLFSSHQMAYVEEFCDDIAILHQGDIVLSGNIKEIQRSYDRRIINISSGQKENIKDYCKNELKDLVNEIKIENDMLRLKLRSGEHLPLLASNLYEKGFEFDSIGVYEPSLNDIFVQYTNNDGTERRQA